MMETLIQRNVIQRKFIKILIQKNYIKIIKTNKIDGVMV